VPSPRRILFYPVRDGLLEDRLVVQRLHRRTLRGSQKRRRLADRVVPREIGPARLAAARAGVGGREDLPELLSLRGGQRRRGVINRTRERIDEPAHLGRLLERLILLHPSRSQQLTQLGVNWSQGLRPTRLKCRIVAGHVVQYPVTAEHHFGVIPCRQDPLELGPRRGVEPKRRV